MSKQKIDDATGVETVGHEWDGIEELNNPLPRWWLWTFRPGARAQYQKHGRIPLEENEE